MNTLFISIMLPAFEFIKIKKSFSLSASLFLMQLCHRADLIPLLVKIVKISLLKRKKNQF